MGSRLCAIPYLSFWVHVSEVSKTCLWEGDSKHTWIASLIDRRVMGSGLVRP